MGAVENLKIAILGAGSIGCYLGGYLQAGGAQVVFIGRGRIKWDLDMKGLTLTHYKRKPVYVAKEDLAFETDYKSLKDADIVLVCVKSQDSQSVGEIIADHTKPDTLVISFQNGVSNPETLRRTGDRPTLAAIVPFNVTSSLRGGFHCGTEGDLIIEQNDDPRLQTLIKAFKNKRMGVKTTPDIINYQWGKLIVNLNNALSALSGGTLREGLSQKSYRAVLADMMEEAQGICQGAGYAPKSFGKASVDKTIKILRMPNALFGPIMNSILKIDKSARSSMLDDLEAGKSSEVEYLQGEIVRLANASGQFAPINGIIRERVLAAFSNNQSPKLSGDDMLDLLDGL